MNSITIEKCAQSMVNRVLACSSALGQPKRIVVRDMLLGGAYMTHRSATAIKTK